MDNKQLIENIKKWQEYPAMHPAICGNNSKHRNLVGVEKDGKVILKCLDCDYEQSRLPERFLDPAPRVEDMDPTMKRIYGIEDIKEET